MLVYCYVVSALLCAAIAVVNDNRSLFDFSGYSNSTWAAVLVLGTVSWGGAMVLWMWVLKRLAASQVAVFIYLLPVFGVILSAVTLGERPGIAQIVGGLLVLAATYLLSEYETRKLAALSTQDFSGRGR